MYPQTNNTIKTFILDDAMVLDTFLLKQLLELIKID